MKQLLHFEEIAWERIVDHNLMLINYLIGLSSFQQFITCLRISSIKNARSISLLAAASCACAFIRHISKIMHAGLKLVYLSEFRMMADTQSFRQ